MATIQPDKNYVKYNKNNSYKGTVTLIAGITQKNDQTFALMCSPDIQVNDDDKRLNEELADIHGIYEHHIQDEFDKHRIAGTLSEAKDDKFTIQEPTVRIDAAGHIDSNALDTYTIEASDKWLHFSTEPKAKDGEAGKIIITHTLRRTEEGETDAAQYGLRQNETIESLDKDNTFEVPEFDVDEAGHITYANTNTVTIPENFTTLTINGNSDATVNLDAKTGIITATTLTDGITITPTNKWIRFSTEGKETKVAHLVAPIPGTTSTPSTDLDNKGKGTFVVINNTYMYDEAGHIISTNEDTHTYKLPHNYETITVSKNETVNSLTSAEGQIKPDVFNDDLKIQEGNKWVNIAANQNNHSITFGHALIGDKPVVKGDEAAQTPEFGGTFKVPYIKIDEAGHTTLLDDHSVTIPIGSHTPDTDGNVIVDFSMTPATGATADTRAYVGNLALTQFKQDADNTDIMPTDTINKAFSKVQQQINEEETARANADKTLTDNLNQEIKDRSAADTTLTTNLDQEIKDRKAAVTEVANNLAQELKDRATGDTDTLKSAKDYTDDAVSRIMGGQETYQSFKDISDYISTHGKEASNMLTSIQANTKDIKGIKTDYSNTEQVTQMIKDAIAAVFNDYDLELKMPNASSSIKGNIATCEVTSFADECEIYLEKYLDQNQNTVTVSAPMKMTRVDDTNTFTYTFDSANDEEGEYKCKVVRIHNNKERTEYFGVITYTKAGE